MQKGDKKVTYVNGKLTEVTIVEYLHETAIGKVTRYSVRTSDGREFVRTSDRLLSFTEV